jgi:hypothetical protein
MENPIGQRELLRHAVATLAYRGAKVLSGVPDGFGSYKVGETSRTPAQILTHLGDLLDWALSLAQGKQVWHDSPSAAWHDGVDRFFQSLARFDAYLASDASLSCPAAQLFQGPVADALTHVGQLAMLRRLAGSPLRGENYFKAEIVAGRVGPDQAAARREFD